MGKLTTAAYATKECFNIIKKESQVKNQLNDLFFLCILTYLGRLLIFGAGMGDALVFLSLTGLYSYKEYLKHKQVPDPSEEIKKELAVMRDALSSLKMSNFSKPKVAVEYDRTTPPRIF